MKKGHSVYTSHNNTFVCIVVCTKDSPCPVGVESDLMIDEVFYEKVKVKKNE